MKDIKVLGPGCANCKNTTALIERIAKEKGVTISLAKVEELRDIMSYGVMSTPGVVVDGSGGPCRRRSKPRKDRAMAGLNDPREDQSFPFLKNRTFEMTTTQRSLPEARQICPTTTSRMAAGGALLVDVREKSEIERLAFDVPNIAHIPLGELEARFHELPRDRELVMLPGRRAKPEGHVFPDVPGV